VVFRLIGGATVFCIGFVCLNKAMKFGPDSGLTMLVISWLLGVAGAFIMLWDVI